MAKWRPTSADITNWHDRRENGESLASIAKLYRVAPETVLRYTPGIPVKRQPNKATHTDIAEWKARRDKGETPESIAIDYDVSPETVRNHIGRFRPDRLVGPPATFDHGRILKMIAADVPYVSIARAIGCSLSLISKVKHDTRRKQGLPCKKQVHPRRKHQEQQNVG